MGLFLARVQCKHGTDKEYTALHKAMLSAGFKNTIPGKGGAEYLLPLAEYFADTPDTLQWVYREACAAAKSVSKDYVVIVSEITGYLCNLDKDRGSYIDNKTL